MLFKKVMGNSKVLKRILVSLAILAMAFSPLANLTVLAAHADSKTPYVITLNSGSVSSTSSTLDTSPTDQMKDGAILHAWCWSFNTIKDNMKAIADAGYTSVQTSPISTCYVGNGGDLRFTNQWYYHYQPTDFTIGNYQLGNEEQFAQMCKVAHEYGIRVIVDAVVNHCTSDYSKISENIKRIPNFFHTNTSISNWNDRKQVTQLAVLGLWDCNTQNSNVQNYIKSYLQKCVALGADGFRYDTAKHVELPDDGDYGSNFWPNVLNNGAQFQYGEVLQDSISRESAYANYMSVVASNYGKKLRDNIGSNNLNASNLVNYDINVSPDKIITWVESHDNYANSITDWGSSQWMTDEQVKLLWGVVCGRAEGTPLFFSRPVGGGGQSWDNRFPEITRMGDRGSSLFMDDEVVAVNKFRNAMDGQSEFLRNPNGDSRVLMIERGTIGAVIINTTYSSYSINSATKLENGSYESITDDRSKFNVSSGTITGAIPARSIVVLMKGGSPDPTPSVSIENVKTTFSTDTYTLKLLASNTVNATYQINSDPSYLYENGDTITIGANDPVGTVYNIELRGINSQGATTSQKYTITKTDKVGTTIYFEKPASWGSNVNAYVYDESGTTVQKIAAWPGAVMVSGGNNTYRLTFDQVYSNPLVIFNDGTNQAPASNQKGFAVINEATYDVNGIKQDNPGSSITVYYNTGWTTANMHYQIGTGAWTSVPGVAMSNSNVSGYKVATIDLGSETNFTACFNNGSGSWDNNNGGNYKFTTPGTYTVKNGVITVGEPTPTIKNSITVYYFTSWTSTNMHYQIGAGAWTTVPGVSMSNSTVSGYKIITVDLGTETTLVACFNNGNGWWDNNSSNNYKFNSPGTYTVKDGAITSGAPK
ncbi:MAG TPA: carbohydrate binding domain-containing protein [Lachnospiraceae bacterium]|nr:carbohydrate binding domain-containing protein [Lachnospiraceae bacterium]